MKRITQTEEYFPETLHEGRRVSGSAFDSYEEAVEWLKIMSEKRPETRPRLFHRFTETIVDECEIYLPDCT